MKTKKIWRTSRRLISWMCARAGLGVRAHIQVGKDQTQCTKCYAGFRMCFLPTGEPQVSVC